MLPVVFAQTINIFHLGEFLYISNAQYRSIPDI